MPILTMSEIDKIANKINGETSMLLWDMADAEMAAADNGYESVDQMLEEMADELPRWLYVITPMDGGNPAAGWALIEEDFGDPGSYSGYSHRGDAPAYEGAILPMPGESVPVEELIKEALSQGIDMPAYGEAPPDVEPY